MIVILQCVRVVLSLRWIFLQRYMTYDLQIRQSADFIIVVCLSQFTLYVFLLGVGASFLKVGGSLFFECGEPQTK